MSSLSEDRETFDRETLSGAWAALAEEAGPQADCPPSERIWAAVAGELSPREVRSTIEHTATCPVCAEAWRIARELTAEGGGQLSQPAPRRFWSPRLLVQVAAGAAAALLLLVVGQSSLQEPPPPIHSGVRQNAAPTAIAPLTAEDVPLPRDDFRLRWSGPAGVRYAVVVATEELETVDFAREQTEASFRVDPAELRDVPAGARLLWQVTAIYPDGRREESPVFVAWLEGSPPGR